MSKARARLKRTLVLHLKQLGVEKKRAHSEIGYMLNRWPEQAVSLAVITAPKDDPLGAALEALNREVS